MEGLPTYRFGFYGKIPVLGDFVTREVQRPLQVQLDTWLQSGLLALQGQRADWLEAYLVTPVWQFLLPPGICGEQACAGLLMPSVDRVGRYFPLLAWAELPGEVALRPLCQQLSALAGRLPEVLQQGLQPEQILELLAAEPPQDHAVLPTALDSFDWQGSRSFWWAKTRADLPFRQVSHRGALDDDLAVLLFGG
ncbi:MAG: type VI secretion system-associated protein TagF [Pseudomonas sp.]|uniref:type VI secretion system-associated protein TagF n=1 Tax=Pseudomonas sp. TaxID=306 RepID=UPI00339226D0